MVRDVFADPLEPRGLGMIPLLCAVAVRVREHGYDLRHAYVGVGSGAWDALCREGGAEPHETLSLVTPVGYLTVHKAPLGDWDVEVLVTLGSFEFKPLESYGE